MLERDLIRIGLAENGGDPSQEGSFIEVSDVETAYREIKGTEPGPDALRVNKFGVTAYRVFFVIAPDGLCYMLGQREPVTEP